MQALKTYQEVKAYADNHGLPVSFGRFAADPDSGFYWPLQKRMLYSMSQPCGSVYDKVCLDLASEILVDFAAWRTIELGMTVSSASASPGEPLGAQELLEAILKLLPRFQAQLNGLPIQKSPNLKVLTGFCYMPVKFSSHRFGVPSPEPCNLSEAEQLLVDPDFWEEELKPYLETHNLVDIKT